MMLAKHLKVVWLHRKYVRKICFKFGLYRQGLLHDLSKYFPPEIFIYKYYTGVGSPHQNCREKIGYSPSWIHHYHKNKHHYQFWLDESETGEFIPIKMPYKYVIESVCDMIGASKAYSKNNWNAKMPYEYWEAKCVGKRIMHKDSMYLTAKLLWNLHEYGEERFYEWYKSSKRWLKEMYESGQVNY